MLLNLNLNDFNHRNHWEWNTSISNVPSLIIDKVTKKIYQISSDPKSLIRKKEK